MGLGPAGYEDVDNVYARSELDIVIKDRSKNKQIVDDDLIPVTSDDSEIYDTISLENTKDIIKKNWK
jgi:hypothetical protein